MLDRYINLLKSGQIVAFPTETVYGLGADAWQLSAVQKVFEAKQRPADNPLIVHISNLEMLHQFAEEIPDAAVKLMNAFWPGPLTLIFIKRADVLDIVTAGLDTVAVRWPAHPLSQDLIERVGPLVAPSANSSGKPSPTKPEHIKEDFGKHFPIIEAGETQIGIESTVLDVTTEPFTVYRPGGISQNQIENIIEKPVQVQDDVNIESDSKEKPKSPGTKYSHYAPKATVGWLDEHNFVDDSSVLYLLHSQSTKQKNENIVCFNEDYKEMAHQLYDCFRAADHKNYTAIRVEQFSEEVLKKEPLAEALKNRIEKATG